MGCFPSPDGAMVPRATCAMLVVAGMVVVARASANPAPIGAPRPRGRALNIVNGEVDRCGRWTLWEEEEEDAAVEDEEESSWTFQSLDDWEDPQEDPNHQIGPQEDPNHQIGPQEDPNHQIGPQEDPNHQPPRQRLLSASLEQRMRSALSRDAELLTGEAINWYALRCGIALAGCAVLGAIISTCFWSCFMFRPPRMKHHPSYNSLRGCCQLPLVAGCFGFVVLTAVTGVLAHVLVGKLRANMELVDARLVGHATEQLGKEFLARLGDLANLGDSILAGEQELGEWPIEIINPTRSEMTITQFDAVIMRSFELVLQESVVIQPNRPGCLVLDLFMDILSLAVSALSFPQYDQVMGVHLTVDVKGTWEQGDFGIYFEADVPFHLDELPSDWRELDTINEDMLIRSVLRGIEQKNENGTPMIDVGSLYVSGTVGHHSRITIVFFLLSFVTFCTALTWICTWLYFRRCRRRRRRWQPGGPPGVAPAVQLPPPGQGQQDLKCWQPPAGVAGHLQNALSAVDCTGRPNLWPAPFQAAAPPQTPDPYLCKGGAREKPIRTSVTMPSLPTMSGAPWAQPKVFGLPTMPSPVGPVAGAVPSSKVMQWNMGQGGRYVPTAKE